MKKWLVFLCLVSVCCQTYAATGNAVLRTYADSKGWLHIITKDGRNHIIRPAKWQAGGGFGDAVIAPDGETVGWPVQQMLDPSIGDTSYSYALAFKLDVWRDGHIIRRFPASLGIDNWIFLKDGNEVAFHVKPAHGQEFYDCTLYSVKTGKELAHWALDRKDYVVPDWAKLLLKDDPLPGPDEISNWFPDTPAQSKKAPRAPHL